MKKHAVTIVSLGIIGVAAVLYTVTERESRHIPERLHPYVNPTDLQAVTISRGTQTLELIPREVTWFMHDQDMLILIDATQLISLLDFFNNAEILQRVTQQTDTCHLYDLTADTALRVDLHTRRGRSHLYIGKQKDHATQFVRLPDDPAVYLVSKTVDVSPKARRWHHKRVLRYAPETLEAIIYDCGSRTLHLQHDAETGALTARDVPEGLMPAKLGTLANSFTDITVAHYRPRSEAPQSDALVTHTLRFTDGTTAMLRFLGRDEENELPPFLDIMFCETEPADEQLYYTRQISSRYVFALSWIDESTYQKNCEDFFTDPPPQPDTVAGDNMPAG